MGTVILVRDGRADAGMLLSPFDDRGLDYEPLVTEPFLVAMAAADPLAARPCLRLADLAGRSLPGGSPADQGVAPGPYGSAGACDQQPSPAGDSTPTAGTTRADSDLPQIFRLVELGSIVCFLPASVTRRYPRPEIAYRLVADLEPATLAVAWSQDSHSAAVAAFVRAAATIAAAAQPQAAGTTAGSYLIAKNS